MHNYKPAKLPMDYTSRNDIIKFFKRYLCEWGIQKTTMTDKGQIIGAPSPLWINPSTLFYKIFSSFTLLCSLLFIGVYIFLRFFNNDNEGSSLTVRDYSNLPANVTYAEFLANTKITDSTALNIEDVYCMYVSFNRINTIFVIIGGAILFLNFFHTMYLGWILEYASDLEWSRLILINLFIWFLMSGFIIADFIYSANLISFYDSNYTEAGSSVFRPTTTKCNQLFKVNMYGYLIVAILMSILAIFQIYKIFQLWKQFFLTKSVSHSACCEDENIIVIS